MPGCRLRLQGQQLHGVDEELVAGLVGRRHDAVAHLDGEEAVGDAAKDLLHLADLWAHDRLLAVS